jgi:hypothetical protein
MVDFNFDHLFTVDPRIIDDQIMASKYKTEIDSKVITKINQHVDDEYFTSYVGSVDYNDYSMYIKYLNSFYNDKKIDKMLYNGHDIHAYSSAKRDRCRRSEEYETISNSNFTTLHNWFKMLYDGYVYFKSHKFVSS